MSALFEKVNNNFRKKLKKIIKESNKTVEIFCEENSFNKVSIKRYIFQNTFPRFSLLINISNTLKKHPLEFLINNKIEFKKKTPLQWQKLIIKNIKKYREKIGISSSAFAVKLKKPTSLWYAYENATFNIPILVLTEISDTFRVPFSYFFEE